MLLDVLDKILSSFCPMMKYSYILIIALFISCSSEKYVQKLDENGMCPVILNQEKDTFRFGFEGLGKINVSVDQVNISSVVLLIKDEYGVPIQYGGVYMVVSNTNKIVHIKTVDENGLIKLPLRIINNNDLIVYNIGSQALCFSFRHNVGRCM